MISIYQEFVTKGKGAGEEQVPYNLGEDENGVPCVELFEGYAYYLEDMEEITENLKYAINHPELDEEGEEE